MLTIHANDHRGQGNYGWLTARYSFSFASWYDARFMGLASLRVINEDKVRPRSGFARHSHDNMEILTYVLAGEVSHADSMGNQTTIRAGEFQLMSAGSGISHSEMNRHPTQTLHLLQIWLHPNLRDTPPSYQQIRPSDEAGIHLIASPTGRGDSMQLKQDAAIYRLKFENGQQLTLPSHYSQGYLHLISGHAVVQNHVLQSGDALIAHQEPELNLTALSAGEALWFDLA